MVTQKDLVVIGGGAMGSASAWQASRRGRDVLLLEQFEFGHEIGASHGTTRNFNQSYAADDYLTLVVEASKLWGELSEQTQRPLLDRVGLINHGWFPPLLHTSRQLDRHGIPNVVVSAQEAGERWPHHRFRTDVLHLPESGRIRAADALRSLRESAEAQGAEFKYGTAVKDVTVRGPESVIVETFEDTYDAKRVIVAAGAWTEKLVSGLAFLPRLKVTQEQPAHFPLMPGYEDLPSFNHIPDPTASEDAYWLSTVYGMYSPGLGMKAGWHAVGPETDPDHRSFQPDVHQLELLQRYAADWLPGVDPSSPVPISCTYTSTESEDFVLERTGPLIVGAGFSGQGFKFTPVIGRILVDLADGLQSPARFRPGITLRNSP